MSKEASKHEPEAQARAPRFAIKHFLFKPEIVTLLSGLLPSLVLIWLFAAVFSKQEERDTSEQLSWHAQTVCGQIADRLRHWQDTMTFLSQADTLENGSQKAKEQLLGEFFEASSGIMGLVFAPLEGPLATTGRDLPADPRHTRDVYPRFADAYERALQMKQGEIEFLWAFQGRPDVLPNTLYLITPVTDDSNEIVIGTLTAQFDLPALIKSHHSAVLPGNRNVHNYFMPEPGAVLIFDDQDREFAESVKQVGLEEFLWQTNDEPFFVQLADAEVMVKTSYVDLSHEFIGNVRYTVISTAGQRPLRAIAKVGWEQYWILLLASLGSLLMVSWLQRSRARQIINPIAEGLGRFRKGDFCCLIPRVAFDSNIDRMVEEINALALESRHNLKHLQLLLESLPLPVMVEQGGQAVFANRSFINRVTGSGYCDELPCPLGDALRRLGLSDSDVKAVTEMGHEESRRVSVNHDGEDVVFDITAAKVFYSATAVSERVLAFWDSTEEARMSVVKSQFVATTAHEFRTPLTVIRGYAELLASGREIPEQQRQEIYELIHERSLVLDRLITEMLDLSRLEQNAPLPLKLEEFDLVSLMDKRSRGWPSLFPDHELEMDLPAEPLMVVMDKDRFSQVLANLITNAVKFSKPGTTVWISLRPLADEYTLICKDEGIGMTASQMKKIFDKFYRVDNSSRAPEGTGIGLATVKGVVEACGGRIEVRSESGKGAEFRVTLPRRVVIDSHFTAAE